MTNSAIDSQYNMACHFLEAQKLPSLKVCVSSDVITYVCLVGRYTSILGIVLDLVYFIH
jgi:hypothetical protein